MKKGIGVGLLLLLAIAFAVFMFWPAGMNSTDNLTENNPAENTGAAQGPG